MTEQRGLTQAEAVAGIKRSGFNELTASRPKNLWRIVLEVMKEPMFILLISCGSLYIFIGEYRDGIILLSWIFIIIGITFFQYRKTERALEALKKLASPRVMVIRDGVETRIPGRELVPKDLIVLHEGDRIPADASIIECTSLSVDESLLTGESMPVLKSLEESEKELFSGTMVVQGKANAIVIKTGLESRLGKIATSIESVKQKETRFQAEMKKLILRLAVAGILISILVVVLFYLTRGNFIQSLLTGLSSAMSILPEEFPVVLTIFLALGAWRLSKKNVLTRNPSAIETLGSATVLCSDKTGTITQNLMSVAAIYNGKSVFPDKEIGSNIEALEPMIRNAFYASPLNSVDPMEKAFQLLFENSLPADSLKLEFLKEYPLQKEFLVMTRVYRSKGNAQNIVAAKGSPEAIFALCKLSAEAIKENLAEVEKMANKGYRILGVANAGFESDALPETQNEFDFKFLGLIALADPIRPEVPQAIKESLEAGVKVIMITGDHLSTAKSIGEQIGLSSEFTMTGDDINACSEAELPQKIKNVRIFARVIPEQKLRIVQALKSNGEVVAMTGDGVNDAPALKAADIGIAMGGKGTDVAREAAALVLLDDNFASIVSAIRLGRNIFDNLQKAMSYIIAIHIPIIGLALLPAFWQTLPILLLPLHIVFMELIIDPVCSIAFESQKEELNIMKRPPRSPDAKFFGMKNMMYSIFQGVFLLAIVLTIYFVTLNEGHPDNEVRAIAFSTLIVGNIFLILTNMSKTRSFLSVFSRNNVAEIIILLFASILLLCVLAIPALRVVFSFGMPGFSHFVPAIIASVSMLIILETIKFFRYKALKTKENISHK